MVCVTITVLTTREVSFSWSRGCFHISLVRSTWKVHHVLCLWRMIEIARYLSFSLSHILTQANCQHYPITSTFIVKMSVSKSMAKCHCQWKNNVVHFSGRPQFFVYSSWGLYSLYGEAFAFITLRASCGSVYCNRSCLWVWICGLVGVCVCEWVGLLPR